MKGHILQLRSFVENKHCTASSVRVSPPFLLSFLLSLSLSLSVPFIRSFCLSVSLPCLCFADEEKDEKEEKEEKEAKRKIKRGKKLSQCTKEGKINKKLSNINFKVFLHEDDPRLLTQIWKRIKSLCDRIGVFER